MCESASGKSLFMGAGNHHCLHFLKFSQKIWGAVWRTLVSTGASWVKQLWGGGTAWSFGGLFSKTARGNIFKWRCLPMHWCSLIQVREVKPSHAVSLWLLPHRVFSDWHLIDWEEAGFHVHCYKPIHLVTLSVILFEIPQATVNSWVPGKAIQQDGPWGGQLPSAGLRVVKQLAEPSDWLS